MLIAKYQRRFSGFDEKIISMYARGMSTREIAGHVQEIYGLEVSPDLISAVTDAVLDEVAAWQARPLDAAYPLVFFDAIRVKIRDEGLVRNKAIHLEHVAQKWKPVLRNNMRQNIELEHGFVSVETKRALALGVRADGSKVVLERNPIRLHHIQRR